VRFALIAKPLIVLSQDGELVAMLKGVTDPVHEVWPAASEIDLSALLMQHHGGVVVLDCAAVAAPIATFTQRLRSQFPDLVLIVAGSVAEQAQLAAQITDGSVYRFLHTPFSEQRVRLFVEAAWRRQAQAPLEAAAPAVPRGRATGAWLGFGVLVLLGAIVAAVTTFGTHEPPVAARAAAPASVAKTPPAVPDAALESLLSRAEQALAAGALVAPAEQNAADLYRQALQRNARDPRALSGIEQVVDRLLSSAEARLQEHNLAAAQQLIAQAQAINPDHPRVALLAAQIGAQNERAVAGRAQQLAQTESESRAIDYVTKARDALERGHLIEPAQDNARVHVEAALALAPDQPLVRQVTLELVARLESEARIAIESTNADRADELSAAAAELGADPALVSNLRENAQQLRLSARAEAAARLAVSFDQRLQQGHLVDPASDSAKFYLAQLMKEDAANPATQIKKNAYAARVLEEAQSSLHAQDFAATRGWLGEAHDAGADATQIGTLEAALAAAQDAAAQANSYLNEGSLTRTHYIAPRFPDTARQRGIEGWVDLQFVVGTDGSVSDATIVGAQPAGVFEPAALEAVRQWRYQPPVRGGQNVSQRVRVRVRFKVQQ
jgi:TonB family protein